MENLDVIGSKVIKLTIYSSECLKNRFLDMLRLTNNVQDLNLLHVRIYQPIFNKNHEQLNLSHLKTLSLSYIGNFQLIQEAFNKVDSLHHLQLLDIGVWNWKFYHEARIDSFEWKELNSLEKLTLKRVTFPQIEAFNSFT
jgi:hypothetical protein